MNEIPTDFSTTLGCPIFKQCGGCSLEKELDKPLEKEEMEHYFSPLPFSFFAGRMLHWRIKARLAVRGRAHNPQIGLFAKSSHDVVDMPSCPLHHHAINRALKIARNEILDSGVEPYDETRFLGDLRYLQFWHDQKTQSVQLTLVVREKNRAILNLIEKLARHPIWHSLWLNVQPKNENRIFGDHYEKISGAEWLTQKILGKDFFFHPATFTQAHLELFEEILLSMRSKIASGARLVEYYAGVGVIGLSLLDRLQKLDCVENNPYAAPCFERHGKDSKARFHSASSADCFNLIADADVAIVDPPRKGVDKPLLDALATSSLKQILYLSCHFPSFKRDCEELKAKGWRVKSAEGYLLFPGTSHIELFAEFTRN